MKLGESSAETVYGQQAGAGRNYSESVAETVDREVRLLIEQAHDEAWKVINDNRDILDQLAAELLEKETLDHVRLDEIFKPVRKLPERPQWLSSPDRPVSALPPVALKPHIPVDQMDPIEHAQDGGAELGF